MKAELLDETVPVKSDCKRKHYKHSRRTSTKHVVHLTESEESNLAKAVSTSNMSAEKLIHDYVISGIKDTLSTKG